MQKTQRRVRNVAGSQGSHGRAQNAERCSISDGDAGIAYVSKTAVRE